MAGIQNFSIRWAIRLKQLCQEHSFFKIYGLKTINIPLTKNAFKKIRSQLKFKKRDHNK